MKTLKSLYPLTGLILVLLLTGTSCQKVATDSQVGSFYRDSSRLNIKKDYPKKDTTVTKKDTTVLKDTTAPAPPPYPQPPATPAQQQALAQACSALPIYGDTIIYPQPANGSDYVFYPVNSPGAGKYFSWPIGMVMDSTTGAIDLTKSETGLKYAIGFVKNGTHDTCLSTLIVGGISYLDSVYVIGNGAKTAAPYYDANAYLPPACSGGGCTFDVTGSAANQKVIVDKNTGVIDLQKTLNGSLLGLGGAFGLIPVNGTSITTTIYYKLNDASNNALQHIDVQLVYYANKNLINSGLLGGIVLKLDNVLNGNLISTSVNPRPPLVIIVQHN